MFRINNIRVLYYDRINVSKGIDVNKAIAFKEYIIFHYWYFQIKDMSFSHLFVMVVMIYQDFS